MFLTKEIDKNKVKNKCNDYRADNSKISQTLSSVDEISINYIENNNNNKYNDNSFFFFHDGDGLINGS